MSTGILTDNVRWAPDGKSIFVGGQDVTVKQALDCFEATTMNCDVPFKIDRMNPTTLKLTEVVKSGVYGALGAGTGAVQIGNNIWVSSFRADRIGILPGTVTSKWCQPAMTPADRLWIERWYHRQLLSRSAAAACRLPGRSS